MAMKKPPSRSLTWAELAAKSSQEQASSATEAAAWERLIRNARRGSLGGRRKKGTETFFFSVVEKREL